MGFAGFRSVPPFLWGGVVGLILLGATAASAQDSGLEITGLVLDETKTKGGRDFFDFFNLNWTPIEGLAYTITIGEQPDRGRGSFIWVKVNDNMVFFKRLNPMSDAIETEVRNALSAIQIHLLRKLTLRQELELPP